MASARILGKTPPSNARLRTWEIRMSINYHSGNARMMCTMPSALFSCFLLPSEPAAYWLLGVLFVIWIHAIIYQNIVLRPIKTKLSNGERFYILFLMQFVFWIGIYSVNKIIF